MWSYQYTPSTRTVDTHVLWLRQKLEPNPRVPQYLVTVYGLGYRFAGQVEPDDDRLTGAHGAGLAHSRQ